MLSTLKRLAMLSSITFSGFSSALPKSDHLAQVRSLTKRAWPVFDWDHDAKDAGDQWTALVMALPEALTIMSIVHLKAIPDQWDRIYPFYFRPDDKPGVEKLFKDILGASDEKPDGDGTGSPLLADIWITNKIVDNDDPCELNPNAQVAWTSNTEDGSGRAVMRFCPIAFKFPLLEDMGCEELSDIVSGKMSSLAGVIVHELTHFNAIGIPAVGAEIIDHDDAGYGPMNVRTLKDNPSMQPKLNADNYRWFAQEFYWTVACSKEFGAPTDNRDQIKCLNQDTGEFFFCPL